MTECPELWLQSVHANWCHLTQARVPGAAPGSTQLCSHAGCHILRGPNPTPNGQIPLQLARNPLKTRRGSKLNACEAQPKHVRVWRRCGERHWLLFLPGTHPSWSLHPQCWSPHLLKRKKNNKKKKKIERKESSLQHSQRRQKLCQRVRGENSNRYKHQHKETQKACLKICA